MQIATDQSTSPVSPVTCPYCQQFAMLVSGREIYPQRPDLWESLFFRCKPCNAHVGCHSGTTRPLGQLANATLRRARIRAHAAFDPLWKQMTWPRRRAYQWLADRLGIQAQDCHIGMFDESQCARVVEIAKQLTAAVRKGGS